MSTSLGHLSRSNQHEVVLERTASWDDFQHKTKNQRLVLLSRESAGVREDVHEAVQNFIHVPIQPGMRSLNIAFATGLVTDEALRQLNGFASWI